MENHGTVTAILEHNYRIRKLTPKECYRLMGFDDNAYNLAAPNQTASSMYHQAGDSIVVDVLENILKELL
jgi:DNA (cytosine-5)-methyltransferase 1